MIKYEACAYGKQNYIIGYFFEINVVYADYAVNRIADENGRKQRCNHLEQRAYKGDYYKRDVRLDVAEQLFYGAVFCLYAFHTLSSSATCEL